MPSPIFLLYIRSIGGVTTAFNLQFDILPKQRKAHFSTHKRVLKWAFHIDSLQTEGFQEESDFCYTLAFCMPGMVSHFPGAWRMILVAPIVKRVPFSMTRRSRSPRISLSTKVPV